MGPLMYPSNPLRRPEQRQWAVQSLLEARQEAETEAETEVGSSSGGRHTRDRSLCLLLGVAPRREASSSESRFRELLGPRKGAGAQS
jgi:hypothetical protein